LYLLLNDEYTHYSYVIQKNGYGDGVTLIARYICLLRLWYLFLYRIQIDLYVEIRNVSVHFIDKVFDRDRKTIVNSTSLKIRHSLQADFMENAIINMNKLLTNDFRFNHLLNGIMSLAANGCFTIQSIVMI